MAFETEMAGKVTSGEEHPFIVTMFYASEVGELAEELGVAAERDEINRFCDVLADELDGLAVVMLNAGQDYIKLRLQERFNR